MDFAMQPTTAEQHYRIAPAVHVDHPNEANDNKWVAHEALGRLRKDLHWFWHQCETYGALAVVLTKDGRPLGGRRAARLLQAGWTPLKVPVHLCDAWSVQSSHTQDINAAMLTALGVGGFKQLHALNEGGYLPSDDTGRRRIARALYVVPNQPPTLLSQLDTVKHVHGVHMLYPLIDELHVNDGIILRQAYAVGMCTT